MPEHHCAPAGVLLLLNTLYKTNVDLLILLSLLYSTDSSYQWILVTFKSKNIFIRSKFLFTHSRWGGTYPSSPPTINLFSSLYIDNDLRSKWKRWHLYKHTHTRVFYFDDIDQHQTRLLPEVPSVFLRSFICTLRYKDPFWVVTHSFLNVFLQQWLHSWLYWGGLINPSCPPPLSNCLGLVRLPSNCVHHAYEEVAKNNRDFHKNSLIPFKVLSINYILVSLFFRYSLHFF